MRLDWSTATAKQEFSFQFAFRFFCCIFLKVWILFNLRFYNSKWPLMMFACFSYRKVPSRWLTLLFLGGFSRQFGWTSFELANVWAPFHNGHNWHKNATIWVGNLLPFTRMFPKRTSCRSHIFAHCWPTDLHGGQFGYACGYLETRFLQIKNECCSSNIQQICHILLTQLNAKYLDQYFFGTECNLSNQLPRYPQVCTLWSLVQRKILNLKPYCKMHSEIQIPQHLIEQTACFLHTLVFCCTPISAFPIVFAKKISIWLQLNSSLPPNNYFNSC